ncbi:restriction endonuclease subunit S [uncultured Pseudomonas sp.]|uniref:restriction endonuclease subunit S n=1 Tax=uncultured Pseudomonas sp. TaxID=114707 RepID=UPI002591461B|nr:restriction endonuclease subunit S [uncultured Pseudomonas sp.]
MSFRSYPAYKNSGVEWLGEVPQNWSIYSLKRTVDGCVNGLWGDEPNGEDDIAVIRVADFERSFWTVGLDKLTYRSITPKERQSRLIKSGDLLIEKSGGGEKTLVGCVVLFTHEFDAITSNFVARMRPLTEFDSRFLCYAFGNLYNGRVNYPSVKQVTGIQNLDAESYLQERFCFPTRVEQTQIARFLDHEAARIDALIEEQQRLIELLKEKRQAVISHAVTKGLDPTVPTKDSGVEWLGEVPAHWDVRKFYFGIKAIIDNRGRSPSYIDSGIPILEARQLSDETMECSSDFSKYISEQSHSEFVRDDVAPGDVLMVTVGTIGKVGVVGENPDYVILQNIVGFRVDDDIESGFMGIYLKSGAAFMAMQATNKESILSSVKVSDFIQHKMPLPPLAEQKTIVRSVNASLSKYGVLQKEAEMLCSTLHERRSALISAAVTGKIDVRGWQPSASAPTTVLDAEAV